MRQEIVQEIQAHLMELQDLQYREFHAKLIPTVERDTIIGVRVPVLRAYAKELKKRADIQLFFQALPHTYFEENSLHMILLLLEKKDFQKSIEQIEAFLPYVDNWATCDYGVPKFFAKHKEELIHIVYRWVDSEHVYTRRYGIHALMQLYLDEDFKVEYLDKVAAIRSEEYYVNMMIAWYFATALAKQYDSVLPVLLEHRLDDWTHNKTIQKACESYRITKEQKAYLRTLKVK